MILLNTDYQPTYSLVRAGTLPRCAVLMLVLALSACSSNPAAVVVEDASPGEIGDEQRHAASSNAALRAKYAQALRHLPDQWRGTHYRLGGNEFGRYIDCSAFVNHTLQHVSPRFPSVKLPQSTLPRTTREFAKLGTTVPYNALQTGDLVFFKTSRSQRHMGIYIEGDYFVHASTSKGVTISKINNPHWHNNYWYNAFWTAKRL